MRREGELLMLPNAALPSLIYPARSQCLNHNEREGVSAPACSERQYAAGTLCESHRGQDKTMALLSKQRPQH